MGAGQSSSERVSISREREDEAFNIVRVSEDAIRTLRGEKSFPITQRVVVSEPPTTTTTKSNVVEKDEKLLDALNDERQLSQRLRQDLLQRQHEIKELSKKLAALESDSKEAPLAVSVGSTEKVKQVSVLVHEHCCHHHHTHHCHCQKDEAEAHYRQKLNELLDRERHRQEESAGVFKQSLERLQQRFLQYSCHTACADLESKVLQCYLQNPREPLRCVGEGDDFIQCVDEYRAKLLTAKEMTVSAN